MPNYTPALFTAATLFVASAALAQQRTVLTADDYARAERAMSYNTQALVDGSMGQPHWLAGDRFWYRVLTARGSEFILVNPARKTRAVAFDQGKLAAALSAASGKTYEAGKLPFRSVDFSGDEKGFAFAAGGQPWNYDIATGKVSPGAKPAAPLNANGDNEI